VNRPLPGPTRDVALLLTRLLLGTIMFAHGYQKLMINGLGRTTAGFESMSIPVAIYSAAFVTVVEVVGSVLVVLGALLTAVAACYLVVMVGAAVFVHIPNGSLIYAILGLVVFAGLTMYDFQRLRRTQDIRTAPLLAASIFLDILNVFLFFLSIFSGGDD